jgi:hypothetical protein
MHRGRPLGSRIAPAEGNRPVLANYLSAPAKRQVSATVEAAPFTGALLGRPRLWVDLLSSQPLCFNLFGPLAEDLELAAAALQLMWPHLITRVTDIRFEWSPGRSDQHYTGNRSAFDVFIGCDGPSGRTFLGIDVKYHEDLTTRPARHEDRYDDIARQHAAFHDRSLAALADRRCSSSGSITCSRSNCAPAPAISGTTASSCCCPRWATRPAPTPHTATEAT